MIKRLFIILFLLLCVPVFAERKLTTNEALKLAIGPFFDSTDGITPETGINVLGLTVEIYREFDADTTPTRFANFVPTASGGVNDMVLIGSSVSGMYSLEVTAAQLNFTGAMILTIVDTDSAGIVGLPLWRPFLLTSANVVDAEYGTDNLTVNLSSATETQIDDILNDTDDIGVAGAGLTAINLPNQVMDISGNITGNLSGSVGSVTADVTTDSASRTASKATGFSTHDAASIWSVVTRILTASTNFNDLSAADVNTEVDNAIITYKLDHLVYAADADDPVNDSIMAMLAATGGDWSTFVKGTDSLQAIRDRGDAGWTTATTVGLSDNAITAAKVHANAWQELIELMFTFDATATYGTQGGSVVDQIADNAGVAAAITTTVATGNTNKSFTLTAGTTEDDAYEKMQITVTDANGKTSTETRRITAWTSGRVVTVDTAFSFTPAASDIVIVERAYLGVSATATIPPRIY